MKEILKRLSVLTGILLPQFLFAEPAITELSKDEALAIAQQQFIGQDADYFILKDSPEADAWTFLVETNPSGQSENLTFTISIPKEINPDELSTFPPDKTIHQFAPDWDFIPILTKNRYGANAYIKPFVKKSPSSSRDETVANRTYAIIISGGINKNVNRERYWNDCSFIYQTLVNKYHIPKKNIYPLMSDGDDPAEDMVKSDNLSYCSQPLDLDFDGIDDIKLAATKKNIKNVLTELYSILKEDDHLFVFVIDHGGHDHIENTLTGIDTHLNSYICLWNIPSLAKKDNLLYDYELKELLEPFSKKYVNLNILLGQCFSGGFIDHLDKINCVVATACKKDEISELKEDAPYDEFVYHWISAINSSTPKGDAVNADIDGNGKITMEEAFIYAKEEDKKRETPLYSSTPLSIGEDLAFNHLPSSVDLYIKDSIDDTGKEPNTETKEFWISPSIWVRNQNDSIYQHENPMYSQRHREAYVYVRIDNRGKADFNGQGKWLHLYWAYASTGLNADTWKGMEFYNGKPTGGHLGPTSIGPIKAGGNGLVMIPWDLSGAVDVASKDCHHFCLLAKITDQEAGEDLTSIIGHVYFDPKNHNDQAQLNVSIIDNSSLDLKTNVFIRNPFTVSTDFSLELVPATINQDDFFTNGFVEMTLTPAIANAWDKGANQCAGLKQIDNLEITESAGSRKVAIISAVNKLDNLTMNPNEFDKVGLKFKFTQGSLKGNQTYLFHLIQRGEKGKIIGGETFIIKQPLISHTRLSIKNDVTPDGKTKLSAEMEDLNSISWYDEDMDCLSDSTSLTMPLSGKERRITAVGINNIGELASETVMLTSPYGIESLTPSVNSIQIKLSGQTIEGSELRLTSATDGTIKSTKTLADGEVSITLQYSSISPGIYVVTYLLDGEEIDARKITLQ